MPGTRACRTRTITSFFGMCRKARNRWSPNERRGENERRVGPPPRHPAAYRRLGRRVCRLRPAAPGRSPAKGVEGGGKISGPAKRCSALRNLRQLSAAKPVPVCRRADKQQGLDTFWLVLIFCLL